MLEELSVHHAVALHHGYVLFGEGIGNHLLDDLGHVRNVGGRLEDGGAAGGDSAHKGVQEQLHGVVPRAHDKGAAQRLPHNVAGRWQHGKGRRLAPAFCPAGKLADGFADFSVHQADLRDEGFFVALVEVFPQGFTEGGFPFAQALVECLELRLAPFEVPGGAGGVEGALFLNELLNALGGGVFEGHTVISFFR